MYLGAPLASYTDGALERLFCGPATRGTVEMPVPANPTEYAVPHAGALGAHGAERSGLLLTGRASLCDVLDETDGGGLSAVDRWGPAFFGGLHDLHGL